MRYSNNQETNGIVENGFYYTLQVWVKDYKIQNCGHKSDNLCHCNARKLAGQDVRGLLVKQ